MGRRSGRPSWKQQTTGAPASGTPAGSRPAMQLARWREAITVHRVLLLVGATGRAGSNAVPARRPSSDRGLRQSFAEQGVIASRQRWRRYFHPLPLLRPPRRRSVAAGTAGADSAGWRAATLPSFVHAQRQALVTVPRRGGLASSSATGGEFGGRRARPNFAPPFVGEKAACGPRHSSSTARAQRRLSWTRCGHRHSVIARGRSPPRWVQWSGGRDAGLLARRCCWMAQPVRSLDQGRVGGGSPTPAQSARQVLEALLAAASAGRQDTPGAGRALGADTRCRAGCFRSTTLRSARRTTFSESMAAFRPQNRQRGCGIAGRFPATGAAGFRQVAASRQHLRPRKLRVGRSLRLGRAPHVTLVARRLRASCVLSDCRPGFGPLSDDTSKVSTRRVGEQLILLGSRWRGGAAALRGSTWFRHRR